MTRFVSEEITSPRTAFLGKLLGLYLLAISFTMFAHAQATVEIMKSIVQDRPLLFIAGLIGVTAGLAIVLAHNVWSGGALPILVTFFGWASLLKGILLLVLPPGVGISCFHRWTWLRTTSELICRLCASSRRLHDLFRLPRPNASSK